MDDTDTTDIIRRNSEHEHDEQKNKKIIQLRGVNTADRTSDGYFQPLGLAGNKTLKLTSTQDIHTKQAILLIAHTLTHTTDTIKNNTMKSHLWHISCIRVWKLSQD